MKIPQILTLIRKNKIKAVAVYNGKEYVDEIEWDYQSEKKRDADAHENKNEHAGW